MKNWHYFLCTLHKW